MAELVCGADHYAWIPDGIYTAQVIGHDSSFCLGKTRKMFLRFLIIEGKYHGTSLFMAFNIPYDMRIRQGSKYYKTWVMVNGWRKPSRNAKMSPAIFRNKVFRIRTATVKPTGSDGKRMPREFWYSKVDAIVEILTGTQTTT